MNRISILSLALVLLFSCKPQKPWSPYDNNSSDDSSGTATTVTKSPADQIPADIGDLEQAVYLDGHIAAESAGPNVAIEEIRDRNKRMMQSKVLLKAPYPQSLWAEFNVKCTRDFGTAPAILRGKIMAGDKVAGTIAAVLGAQASKIKLAAKVDLLKPFQGNLPDTFLAKLDGDLYLMPIGTDENKVNPETDTSESHSKAIYATIIRVTLDKSADTTAATSAPAAPAEAPPSTPAPPTP